MSLFGDGKGKQLEDYANKTLEDDLLTADEEKSFLEFATSIGIPTLSKYPDILNRLTIARVNDGRLPVLGSGDVHIVCKPGEVVHLEANAALLKEVAVREWKGSGFSFPIAMGVRYRTSRGHMQQVGTSITVGDTGILSVTSHRIVFSGRSKTQESLYGKLVNLTVYTDGIGIAVSNRQNVSTYRITSTTGEVVAAVANAALQKLGSSR